MRTKVLTSLFTFTLVFASTLIFGKTALSTCPNSKIIKSTSFNTVQKGDHPGVWTFIQNNHKYNTSYRWEFSLMVEANDQSEATKKANLALSHLQKIRGPEKINGTFVCDYKSKLSLSAVAVSKP